MNHTIAIVGEAWGKDEAKARAPFVGYSGMYLTQLLRDAGINRQECFLTNVFNFHPSGDDLDTICGTKAEGISGYPALSGSKHVRAEFIPEIERLGEELVDTNPNVIIATGNTAMWALLGKTGISKFRGVVDISSHTAKGFKVLPTYHPMAVLHQISLRPTVILDLQKALRESAYPDLRRPKREIWIEPTLEDLHAFTRHIHGHLAVDIETIGNQVTCIGFSPSQDLALVIPFHDSRRKGRSYWPTPEDERAAWEFVREILADPRIKKVFQNGMYDVSFLYRSVGIRVYGCEHDSMLLHHALQPEALKSLAYLGGIYTNEAAWKQVRGKTPTIKRDA